MPRHEHEWTPDSKCTRIGAKRVDKIHSLTLYGYKLVCAPLAAKGRTLPNYRRSTPKILDGPTFIFIRFCNLVEIFLKASTGQSSISSSSRLLNLPRTLAVIPWSKDRAKKLDTLWSTLLLRPGVLSLRHRLYILKSTLYFHVTASSRIHLTSGKIRLGHRLQ